jgi:glycosyltransferase involved in cell wall biosynthesis
LRILLATYYLRDWSGSELFTAALARSLGGRGHDVLVHSPFVGTLARRLNDKGVEVNRHLSDISAFEFDVAHVHHNVVAAAVRSVFPQLPMVMLLHGVLPELEQPPSSDLGIARYLCVSEEVQQQARLQGTFGAPTEVVRNFLSAEHWATASAVNPKLENVLVLSNDYPTDMRGTVEAACAVAGANLRHVGLPDNPQEDVRPDVAWADLVITLGRGALEAMAMGRNVVVLGSRGGDGFVDADSFLELRERNFSGRTRGTRFTPETLATEMRRYDPKLGSQLRELVLAENGEDRIVTQLERIYQEVARETVRTPADNPLLRELSFLYQEMCSIEDRRDSLGARLHENETVLASVYSSKSWRWTAFLRWILSLVHRS